MNNNFKKLLASAMALAMVTSVMPAVSTDVDAASCTYTDIKKADDKVAEIVYNLKQQGKTVYNVAVDGGIDWDNLNVDLSCATTAEGKHLAGMVAGVQALENMDDSGYMHVLWRAYDRGVLKDNEITDNEWNNTFDEVYTGKLSKFYEDVLSVEKYVGNLSEANKDEFTEERVDLFLEQLDDFKKAVADYKGEYYEDFLKDFVDYLAGTKSTDGVFEVELTALADGTTYPRTNLKGLKERLEKVKESDEYALYSDEDEVVEIIDAIESMIEDIETVNEILDSKSDAAKALKQVKRLVKDYANETNKTNALKKIKDFTEEDIKNLNTYIEDVVNEFFTFETKKRASGRYYVKVETTDLAMYLEKSGEEYTEINEDVYKILTTIFDEDMKNTDTYYDVLVEEDKSSLSKADLVEIVEDAKGVELKWTYTTKEVDLVENALTALKALLPEDGSNPYELNTREKRTLNAEKVRLEKISKRMEDAKADIEITKDWWVFENGQWVFYQDGKVAPNRWVADHNNDWYYAGANGVMLTNAWIARDSKLDVWYYVGADGKMVTNTTVDGCVIDANGVWHA